MGRKTYLGGNTIVRAHPHAAEAWREARRKVREPPPEKPKPKDQRVAIGPAPRGPKLAQWEKELEVYEESLRTEQTRKLRK
jgi:hypothetical protein